MAEKLPENNLKTSVHNIWQEKLLFDYTIEVEDEEFRVHKVIMASVSDYFKAMLTGGMAESQTDRVRLEGLEALAVSNIIEYIYTNEISASKASPYDILASAVYLQIASAIETATQLLSQEINAENCFDILLTFQTYSLKDAADKTEQYIKEHLDEALKVTDVDKLPWQSVATLVKVWNKSEWDLFVTVKEWVEVDLQNRKQLLDKVLLEDFVFYTLTPSEIESIKKMKIYLEYKEPQEHDGTWQGCLEGALEYHDLPIPERIHFALLQVPPPRSAPSLVVFNKSSLNLQIFCKLNKINRSLLCKLNKNNQWIERASDVPPLPEIPNGAAAAIEVNNFLFVCEKYTGTGTQDWHVFDPRALTWTQVASFNVPRHDFALVHDYNHIYALGGRIGLGTDTETITDTIERYDFEKDTWTIVPFKLPTPRHRHLACCLSCYIFVTGGWESIVAVGKCSSRIDALDLTEEQPTWIIGCPVPIATRPHLMHTMNFNNEQVIVLINKNFIIQYYQPFTGRWSVLDGKEKVHTQLKWRNDGIVLANEEENCLYFLNFFDKNNSDYFTELNYESADSDYLQPVAPQAGKWTFSADSESISEKLFTQRHPSDRQDICAVLRIPPRSKKTLLPHDGSANVEGKLDEGQNHLGQTLMERKDRDPTRNSSSSDSD